MLGSYTIETGKELSFTKLASYRTTTSVDTVNDSVLEFVNFLKQHEYIKSGPFLSVTHSVTENTSLDIEFLVPIDRPLHQHHTFKFKPELKLYNCLYTRHSESPERLNDAYRALQQYLDLHQLQSLTGAYSVTIQDSQYSTAVTDIYIAINPNIT